MDVETIMKKAKQYFVKQVGFSMFSIRMVLYFQPPPPGYAPNAAQMASMSGANVSITQRPSDFFTGGSDGGYTIF